jgi:hypothetical protein
MENPELKRAVCEQCEAFGATVVLIEDKASGTQLIQELVQQGLHAVTRYQPQSAMIENGFVHLLKDAAWLPEYLHELTVFPKGKARRPSRLDRPDARLAQAIRPRAAGLAVANVQGAAARPTGGRGADRET